MRWVLVDGVKRWFEGGEVWGVSCSEVVVVLLLLLLAASAADFFHSMCFDSFGTEGAQQDFKRLLKVGLRFQVT
jgi:hypothetical protein